MTDESLKIEVIGETPDFAVINKPAGVTVHRIKHLEVAKANRGEDDKNEVYLTDWILGHYPETASVGDDPEYRPGIVHRLDKETSGALLIARNQESFDYMKALFQEGRIKKTYLALVYGEVRDDNGIIEKPIGLLGGSVKRTIHGGKMVKEAITEFRVKHRFDDFTLVEVSPKTGRTHQIRVHMASIGHPIVGDKLYGGKKEKRSKLSLGRQFLHAFSLVFIDRDGVGREFEAKLPGELTEALKSI